MEGLSKSIDNKIKESPENVEGASPIKVLEHIMFMNPIIAEGGMITGVYMCEVNRSNYNKYYPVFVEIITNTGVVKRVNIKEVKSRDDSPSSVSAVKSLKETYIEKFSV